MEDRDKQYRRIRYNKMEKVERDVHKKLVVSKANDCIEKVERLVRKEIENGKTINEAMRTIKDSKSITKIYSQLSDDQVKALVLNTIKARIEREEKNNN